MSIGASVLTTAIGAILYWAVDYSVSGVDVRTVGVILMVAGIAGLLLSLMMSARRTHAVTTVQDGTGRVQSQRESHTQTM
jgi:hypothetical protein